MLKDIKNDILHLGADLVGFADLTSFSPERRLHLPYGIAIAVAVRPETARQVLDAPKMDYYHENERLNAELDRIGLTVQNTLTARGYTAVAQTIAYVQRRRGQVGPDNTPTKAPMPHKTIAALAGIGWVGKNSLLITEKYGSAVRLTSVLTDAPVPAAEYIYQSRCGSCRICVDACPGGVIRGNAWTPETDRDELIDFSACRKTVVERGRALGITHASCGICMSACPQTMRHLK
jgi:epoxyqueuosine reductase QueG